MRTEFRVYFPTLTGGVLSELHLEVPYPRCPGGKHYVSKRSRRQKEIPAFPAQEGNTHTFCHANAQLCKESRMTTKKPGIR